MPGTIWQHHDGVNVPGPITREHYRHPGLPNCCRIPVKVGLREGGGSAAGPPIKVAHTALPSVGRDEVRERIPLVFRATSRGVVVF